MVKHSDLSTYYISQMTQDDKIIFVKILTHLGKVDNHLSEIEKKFVEETALMFGIDATSIPDLFNTSSAKDLIALAKKITNRTIALNLIKEACFMANSDGSLSDEEIVFIGQIGQAMGIELEKIEQISQWVIDLLVWRAKGRVILELD